MEQFFVATITENSVFRKVLYNDNKLFDYLTQMKYLKLREIEITVNSMEITAI